MQSSSHHHHHHLIISNDPYQQPKHDHKVTMIAPSINLFVRTGSGMVEFETVEEAVEALVLVNNLRVEGVQGEAEGMEFDIKLCFSRTFM